MTTAAATAAAVAAGELRAVEVAERALALAEETAELNAFTHLDPAAVRDRARTVDRHPEGSLAGVPVALKDLIDQQGIPTTAGSSFFRSTPRRSAAVVERLESAGAVILGRTGLHEFAFGFSSENPWWGAVRNPWDPETSPGGSSGGSAAAVAAGVVPVAVGTDTGGSIRVPAALCGLVGLKVTHGRVSLRGVFPLAGSLDTVGPLARSVADTAEVYRVMAGDDPQDPWSAPAGVDPEPPGTGSLGALTIGIPRPWVDRPLDDVTAAGFRTALDRMADAGARIEEVTLPSLGPAPEMQALLGAQVAGVHRAWFCEDPSRYGADVARRIERALGVSVDDLAGALRWQAGLRHALARGFDRFDLLATPTVAAHRKHIGASEVETGSGPEAYRRALSWFTAPVNHAGLPALALPLNSPGNPPPSLQLIGPMWSEYRLLAAGAALEEAGIAGFREAPQRAST